MYKFLLVFLSILIFNQTNAQKQISGKIFDQVSKSNLVGASIYVNNSSTGTVSNNEGEFRLIVSSSDEVELVVSYLQYEKKIYKIKIAEEFTNKMIGLTRKENVLNQVSIQGKLNKKNWKKWFDIFRGAFIGTYDHGGHACVIKNPEVIRFSHDIEKNDLKATAEQPIIIENIRTKYLITIDLNMFKYNMNNRVVQFSYTASFKDLSKPSDVNVRLSRNEYYYSSQMHFLRSLYKDSVKEEGFASYKMRWVLNEEKLRVDRLIRRQVALSQAYNHNIQLNLADLFTADTASYYQKVLKQDDYVDGKLDTVDLSKFKKLNSNGLLEFKPQDTLLIYHIRTEEQIKKRSSKEWEVRAIELNKIVPTVYRSVMFLYGDKPVYVNSNGKFTEGQLYVEGNMSRKISGLLPNDFEPYPYVSK